MGMRRIELGESSLEIVLTGLTMIEAMQSRLSIPYAHIDRVLPHLAVRPNLLRMSGTAIGPIQEGHYIDGQGGWYFLSYENADRVITIELNGFRLGKELYRAVVLEVDEPQSMAEAIQDRVKTALGPNLSGE
jgi:hypothetical protein